jgi:hypothetical protein
LVGKPEGPRALGRSKRRCEDKTKLFLEKQDEDVHYSAHNRHQWRALANIITGLWVP